MMGSFVDLNDGNQALDLSRIRHQLMYVPWSNLRPFFGSPTRSRLEDTIIFSLIERVQFALNKTIYVPGALHIPNSNLSFFDWYLSEQERLQSLIRRYESPDELPYFPQAVQKPILKPLNYPQILYHNNVDVNNKIKTFYIDKLLPAVCPDFGHGDRGETQENYGSAATCDIVCLQALSRRIHFGKFVAESKFRSETEKFTLLIKAGDRKGIDEAITDRAVELQIYDRLRLKARNYGKDPGLKEGSESHIKIDVEAVATMYEKYVIPLTKEVEVEYLMQRLESSS